MVEWIDSESNPSDGLSRSGAIDEWTLTQGWNIRDARVPDWADTDFVQHLAQFTLGVARDV